MTARIHISDVLTYLAAPTTHRFVSDEINATEAATTTPSDVATVCATVAGLLPPSGNMAMVLAIVRNSARQAFFDTTAGDNEARRWECATVGAEVVADALSTAISDTYHVAGDEPVVITDTPRVGITQPA